MEQLVFVGTLAFLCICTAMGKTSWEPPKGSENVNLKEFLNTTSNVWTVYATSPNRTGLCKEDRPRIVTHTEVRFFRPSTAPLPLRNSMELLTGKFLDLGEERGPSAMHLYTKDHQQRGTEELVYEDRNRTCGIFLTTPMHTFSGRRYDACELRVKGGNMRPHVSTECTQQFVKICDPEKTLSVYSQASICITFRTEGKLNLPSNL